MMAAYQPQPGAMHPGMAPHAHPGMAQGQPITAAQMPQMGHPGAVTPGPHVTQPGTMMGMQPGANGMGGPAAMAGQPHMGNMPAQMGGQSMAGVAPNSHALSMNPQAAMQQHHMMQQHLQANPQLAMQQQALMAQRRAMMQANGLAGMQPGAMQGFSPQQIAQLQQNSAAMQSQLPQLPQHMVQQQMMLRQQQAQQQAAAAQHQQLQQQQIAMQQAQNNAQGAQQGGQNPQGAQQQHPGPPMRPQSRMANANEQTPGATQQNTQGQANTQPGQGQQQPPPQGQNNSQPVQQPNNMQQPGQPQQAVTPQQMQALQRQRQMQQMQHQNALQRQMQAQQAQQQQQSGQGGLFILKVVQFMDHLGSIDGNNGRDIANWHNFVDRHFAPDARFTHAFAPPPGAEDTVRVKRYEVPRATIARYFQTYFDSKADNLRLHLEKVRETPMLPNRHQVSFENATFAVSYPNGARLEMKGSLQVLFAPGSDNIELMELYTQSIEEHVNRMEIEKVLSNWPPSMGNKTSPKLAKNKPPKAQQKMQPQYEGLTIDDFPRVPTGKLGITQRVQQFLELDETMCIMADLISLAQERKCRPDQALEAMVAHYNSEGGAAAMQQQTANPQFNFHPNGIPMGNRTPSMQNMQMPNAGQFSSPSVSNLNLPMQNGMAVMNGSPHIGNHIGGLAPNMNMANSHTPSPHQSNMAAPAMMPQHSQQGTNSSAASANTSPNQNNKRRRSQVKMEGGDDGNGADGGAGNRVKPSPRMPKKAKPGS